MTSRHYVVTLEHELTHILFSLITLHRVGGVRASLVSSGLHHSGELKTTAELRALEDTLIEALLAHRHDFIELRYDTTADLDANMA